KRTDAARADPARIEPAAGEAGLAAIVAVGLGRLAAFGPGAAELLDQLALLAPEPAPLTPAAPGAAPGCGRPGGAPAPPPAAAAAGAWPTGTGRPSSCTPWCAP